MDFRIVLRYASYYYFSVIGTLLECDSYRRDVTLRVDLSECVGYHRDVTPRVDLLECVGYQRVVALCVMDISML